MDGWMVDGWLIEGDHDCACYSTSTLMWSRLRPIGRAGECERKLTLIREYSHRRINSLWPSGAVRDLDQHWLR